MLSYWGWGRRRRWFQTKPTLHELSPAKWTWWRLEERCKGRNAPQPRSPCSKQENKAGYTANTSCGRVGRGGNARCHTFQLDHHGPTDGRTNPLMTQCTGRRKFMRHYNFFRYFLYYFSLILFLKKKPFF